MSFLSKVVLISGASSGIGFATAVHFAKEKAKLIVTGRNIDNINKLAKQIARIKPQNKILTMCGDVTDEKFVVKLLESTIAHYGRLDVLVNNAGIWGAGDIESTSLAQYHRIINTNVRSVYHLTMLAVPHLIKTKGNIVNVSSVTGTRSFPGVLSYCLSKAALDQFTKCTALELAEKGVRVNSVNPGGIVTNIQKSEGMSHADYEGLLVKSKETHPLGRTGAPEEVAAVIAFLASDAANFTTGELLHIDGGRHAACPR